MTAKEREQVVELLRCAADEHRYTEHAVNGMWGAPYDSLRIWHLAWSALDAVPGDRAGKELYRAVLLEAAARVEEGSWMGGSAYWQYATPL